MAHLRRWAGRSSPRRSDPKPAAGRSKKTVPRKDTLLYLLNVRFRLLTTGFRAIKNLSLCVLKGDDARHSSEPNGPGKTTMMEIITGQDQAATRPARSIFDAPPSTSSQHDECRHRHQWASADKNRQKADGLSKPHGRETTFLMAGP